MTIYDWLQQGYDEGWCSDLACEQHDRSYLTDDEANALLDGEDICVSMVRIYLPPTSRPVEVDQGG